MVTFESDTLNKLCSEDQLLLMDLMDKLRAQGINNYISLPQIIVCGDQSSGKSSVLEAISGVAFPVKSNLCTRFPTELVLRRAPQVSVSVSIVPHDSRSKEERDALRAFREKLDGFDNLPDLVERAKVEMGITAHRRAFAKDILRVEIAGPDRPHLTLVDLPGLIHSESKNQTASDVELIRDVVKSYMEEPRCIILAVVLKLARAADPSGNRTLGIITKPDTLVPGGDSESLYVSLAKNQQVEFQHGWHVVKNMDSEKGACSLPTRDAEEAEFFSTGAWTTLAVSSLGIDRLRGRLSTVLLRQIASELPGLLEEIEQRFTSCRNELEKLGAPRASLAEQQLYLVQLSQSFQHLVKMSVGGIYNGPFFADAKTDSGYQQRIRAIVQNLNEDFASDMLRRGHYRQVTDLDINNDTDLGGDPTSGQHHGPIQITRDDFINQIQDLMSRTRGCELPGTFNPMIVADLFREQCYPWKAIVRRHVEELWDAAACFVKLVIAHIADAATASTLKREVFEPALEEIWVTMRDKTTELLNAHRDDHPITYNHYFTETLQKVRHGRRGNNPEQILREFFRVDSLHSQQHVNGYYNLRALAESLAQSTEADMGRFAAGEALDCLNAYYKVALKRFVDDVAVQVVEAELMSALDKILSPVSVVQMPPEQIARIAGESEETHKTRERLVKQLEVFQNGMETCKRFASIRIGGESIFVPRQGTDNSGLASLANDSFCDPKSTAVGAWEAGSSSSRTNSPPLVTGLDGAEPTPVSEFSTDLGASLDAMGENGEQDSVVSSRAVGTKKTKKTKKMKSPAVWQS